MTNALLATGNYAMSSLYFEREMEASFLPTVQDNLIQHLLLIRDKSK